MPRLAPPRDASPTLGDALAMWERHLKTANRSPRTLGAYMYAARHLVEHVSADRPIDKITRTDHETLMAALFARGWKPASVSTVYRPLRSFWSFVAEHPDLPVDKSPMNGMAAPQIPEVVVEFLSDDELRAVIRTCVSSKRHNYRGIRDAAIIRVFACTGARLAEVTGLRVQDVATDFSAISVLGKGRRWRDLPLDVATTEALRTYTTRERSRSPHARLAALWLSPKGAMTGSGIGQMIAERGKAAGIERRIHPHELRHRFIASVLGAGLSEGDAMALSGHRSRSMLDRYGAYTRSERAQDAFRKASAAGLLPKV